jgi:hypothetical protein
VHHAKQPTFEYLISNCNDGQNCFCSLSIRRSSDGDRRRISPPYRTLGRDLACHTLLLESKPRKSHIQGPEEARQRIRAVCNRYKMHKGIRPLCSFAPVRSRYLKRIQSLLSSPVDADTRILVSNWRLYHSNRLHALWRPLSLGLPSPTGMRLMASA